MSRPQLLMKIHVIHTEIQKRNHILQRMESDKTTVSLDITTHTDMLTNMQEHHQNIIKSVVLNICFGPLSIMLPIPLLSNTIDGTQQSLNGAFT